MLLCADHKITLPKPGYWPDVLFAGRSRSLGQRGIGKQDRKEQPRVSTQDLYPDTRPCAASSRTFVSWTIPLVFPSVL